MSDDRPKAWQIAKAGTTPTLSPLGFLIREPEDVYHAKSREYVTSHGLAEFRESPWIYRQRQLGLVPEVDLPAYRIGRALHVLVLEGRSVYQLKYRTGPRAKTDETTGQEIITENQAALVEEMAAAVEQNQIAKRLLRDGVAEGVIRCEYLGVPCQARIDWTSANKYFVDLKTCERLLSFNDAIRAFGYVYQLAFYQRLIHACTAELYKACIIAVQKTRPCLCGVWHITQAALDKAAETNKIAIEALRRCREQNEWPTTYEEIRVFDLHDF